ncbi:MAG TPA: hypothetical protein VF984_13535 [Actinomycetota bacterium]
MFPTEMGAEMARERVRDLRALAARETRGSRHRWAGWRVALGARLVELGERLRAGTPHPPGSEPVRIP